MAKVLYILIGPKGSGKSYIGRRIEQLTGINFLSVESIWLKLAKGEDGWERVEREIDHLFQQCDRVAIESLGIGEGFSRMYASLMAKYSVKLIKVETDLTECLRRVKSRDQTIHIPVSDKKIQELNRNAVSVDHPWDGSIDNNHPVTDEEILKVIFSLEARNME